MVLEDEEDPVQAKPSVLFEKRKSGDRPYK